MKQISKISEFITDVGCLIKYKLSAAVTLSAITGYFIFETKPGTDLLFLFAGLFCLSGGAAALNQVTESRYDSLMQRTKERPIPGKKLSRKSALTLSMLFIITGLLFLYADGIVPMALGLLNLVLYNLVYTSLKRVSPLALIPGSLVGALPPVIGFTAAGGLVPDDGILLFSAFMFLWQIPHFWLISIRYADDYKAAGFKLYKLFRNTGNPRLLVFLWILLSTGILIGFSLYEVLFHWPLYLFLIPLNLIFIFIFYLLLFRPENEQNTRSAFILINSFSVAIMLIFIINSFLSAI